MLEKDRSGYPMLHETTKLQIVQNFNFEFLTPDGEWAIYPCPQLPTTTLLVYKSQTVIPFKGGFCGFDPKTKKILNFMVSGEEGGVEGEKDPILIESDLSKFSIKRPNYGFSQKYNFHLSQVGSFSSRNYAPLRPDIVRFFIENVKYSKIVRQIRKKPESDLLDRVTDFKNQIFQFPLVGK